MDLEQIRIDSIQAAREIAVVVSPALPVLDSGLKMRDAGETVSRLAMNAVAATAYGFDETKAIEWLKQEGLTDSLSQQEGRFILNGIGNPDHFREQIEGMWALAWSVGIVGQLDFASDYDDRFVLMLPNLKKNQSSADFRRRALPCPLDEVIAACDLAYCLHWAIRQNELMGEESPAGLKPYVVAERRRALEWALSEDEWDEITLDT